MFGRAHRLAVERSGTQIQKHIYSDPVKRAKD
jgi:hypothetical protein